MIKATATRPVVLAAFVSAVRSLNSRRYHSKWIPSEFWVFVVNKELQESRVDDAKLRKHLDEYTNRDLKDDNDTGEIIRIKTTTKRIKRREGSSIHCKTRTKVKHFLRVETTTSREEDEIDSLPQELQIRNFQTYYYKYKALIDASTDTTWTRENTESNPVEFTTGATAPVVVNALDAPENSDIKAILATALNPELLKRKDLFIGDGDEACERLREAMHRFGIRRQTELNEQTYRVLAPDDRLSEQINSEKHLPLLRKFCCPFNKRAIQGFISIAVKIADENTETNILKLQNYGGRGKGKSLVPITPSTTRKTLHDNGRIWLPKLYDAIVANGAIDRRTLCYQMIMLHRKHSVEAFEDACRAKGPVGKTFKMDPHRQFAMCKKANLTYAHLREMRPFMIADKCNPFVSESKMRTMLVSPTVDPVFIEVEEEKIKRQGWYLPVDELVREEVAKQSRSVSFDRLDVIFSADHGQKVFRCSATALGISTQEKKIVFEKSMLVGNIECRKDTRQLILESGLASAFNSSMENIKDNNGGLYCSEKPVYVQLKAVGDLALFSLALGKESMSGKHCWRCDIRWEHIQEDPFKEGVPWTLASMAERFEKLESGEMKRKNKDLECGLTHPALLNQIEPEHWLTPILHAIDLLTNTVFEYLQKYMWYRLEDVPLELIAARIAWAEEDKKRQQRWEEYNEAEQHLTEMRAELGRFEEDDYMDDDDDDETYEHLSSVVKAAEEATKEAKDALKDQESELRKAKSHLNDLEKDSKTYGKCTRSLWMQVQEMLKAKFNVKPSSYHGGAMEGNECRAFLRNVCQAMAETKRICLEFLSTLSPAERNERADEKELDLYLGGFQRLLQYMDLMSHYCYQEYGSMSDSDVEDACRTIDLATSLWHKIMPTVPMKVHAWRHLKEDIKQHRGMKSHNEHPIEKQHQEGVRHARRLGCVKDYKMKTNHIRIHTATAESTPVKAMVQDTEAGRLRRKRKKKHETVVSREERSSYLKGVLELPVIEDDFETLLDLQKAMPRVPEE